MTSTLVGKPAPSLTLPSTDGDSFTLTPGQGKPIALFFFPTAGSWGCTVEACQFRDAVAENVNFKNSHVQVVGVSGDSVEKQKAFVKKNNLTYPILSDAEGKAREAYDVGKGLFGYSEGRVTFVIDGKGIVRDRFEGVVNFTGHHKFVDKWLRKLEAEEKGEPYVSEPSSAAATPDISPNDLPPARS